MKYLLLGVAVDTPNNLVVLKTCTTEIELKYALITFIQSYAYKSYYTVQVSDTREATISKVGINTEVTYSALRSLN